MTRDEILELPVMRWDLCDTLSMREYFERLIIKLWDDPIGFNAYRPYGNSGWKWDVYVTLIKHKVIEGELDEDGCVKEVNEKAASKFVAEEILYPFFMPSRLWH